MKCEIKLTQRFLHFAETYINEDFYFEECSGRKILKDDLMPALKNAYNIRSKYAHSLKKIVDQSAVDDISRNSDFFRELHEPYLTYSGLLRLTRHIIFNLLLSLEKVDKEDIDWINKPPGMITAYLAPEFWLSKMENDKWEEKARYNSINDKNILQIVSKKETGQQRINLIWEYVFDKFKKKSE